MGFRPKRSTPLLRDRFGPWCGWCGDRIDPNRLHYHHIDQQWASRTLAPLLSPIGDYAPLALYDWRQFVVPVHRECHPSLDEYSRTVASAVFGSYDAPVEQVERTATKCFEDGEYAIAVRLRQGLRRYHTVKLSDETEQRRNFKFELVAAAGLWFFRCHSLPQLDNLPQALRPDLKGDPSYAPYLLNPLCTFGLEGALDLVRAFAERLPARREDIRAKLARLESIISMHPTMAEKAAEMSDRYANPHGQITAVINNAWVRICENSDGEALTELSKIDFMDITSWWQSFQVHFAHGCSQISDKWALARTLIALLQAQTVMVVKGFRGWVVPDVRLENRPPNQALYPEHVIEWLIERHDLSREYLDEIRKNAVSQRMLRRLWTPPAYEWPATANVNQHAPARPRRRDE